MTTARDFAENAWLAVTARFAMIALVPLFGVTAWFGGQWLDGRFSAQASATTAVVERVKSLEDDNLPGRLGILESTILIKGLARDRQLDAITAEQLAQGARIDKLVDAVNALATSNAALTATIKAQESRP